MSINEIINKIEDADNNRKKAKSAFERLDYYILKSELTNQLISVLKERNIY